MNHVKDLKDIGFHWIEENGSRLIDCARKIWEHPELGLEEHQSFRVLADFLTAEGFGVEKGVAGIPTAFVATWGEGKPVIGINCEYDALPGLSQEASARKEPLVPGPPGTGAATTCSGPGPRARPLL